MDNITITVQEDDTQVTVSVYEGGVGFMKKSVYDPSSIGGNVFDMDNMVDGATNRVFSNTEKTKLSGIETGAEVNDVNSVNGQTETVVINEQDISGTRRTANVTTTDSLDWDAYSVFELTMTGNTTFSDSNLPTGTGVKVIEIILDGNFSATFPSYWEADPNNDTYDGSVRNRLLVSCINGTTSSEDVIYTLTNLST